MKVPFNVYRVSFATRFPVPAPDKPAAAADDSKGLREVVREEIAEQARPKFLEPEYVNGEQGKLIVAAADPAEAHAVAEAHLRAKYSDLHSVQFIGAPDSVIEGVEAAAE